MAAEYNPWFPQTGLVYEIFRPQAFLADATSAEITYVDPMDNGAVRQFFLDRTTSSSVSGGAVLQQAQGNALKTSVEMLIDRADDLSLTTVCN